MAKKMVSFLFILFPVLWGCTEQDKKKNLFDA